MKKIPVTLIFLGLLSLLLICSCSDSDHPAEPDDPNPTTQQHKMQLTLRLDPSLGNTPNSKAASDLIENIQILLFNEDSICIKVIPIEPADFDENNTLSVTMTVPVSTVQVTVLANAIGYTSVVQANFIGMTRQEIYLITRIDSPLNPTYYNQPEQLFEGHNSVRGLQPDETINVDVTLTRVISKIVIQLDKSMQFDITGRYILAINSPVTVRITGIDSIFISDVPAGVNLPISNYWDNVVGFNQCEIFKTANFTLNATGNLYDSIYVFPQIGTSELPYITLSVTGIKAGTGIGAGSVKRLYYGIRIRNVTDSNGNIIDLSSLPRNSIITVTINNFSGPGFDNVHPDPNLNGLMNVNAVVKNWGTQYDSSGDAE